MDQYRKRKLKKKLYQHSNIIAYICIFAVASIITLAAALSRDDRAMIMDNSQLAVTQKESIELKNKDAQKVASKEETKETSKKPESGTQVKIIVDTLNVRAKASQESEPLGMVDAGEVFQIISQGSEWIEIDYNGNNGFVKKEYVEVQ